ncbi:MAG: hypothetical protein ABII00_11815 [Elusimicrobiota bacterium]
MKCLFIADRPQDLHPDGDTTLYMIREALKRGFKAFYTVPERVYWSGASLYADADPVRSCAKHTLPRLGPREKLSFQADVDAAFIRKDPPFDQKYISLCWLLAAHESRILMLNKPSLLLRYHEKVLPLDAVGGGFLGPEDIVPTCLTADWERAEEFVRSLDGSHIVLKPWLGYGGNDIRRIEREAFLKDPRGFALEGGGCMIQPYYDAVERDGDRRGFFFRGKYFGSVVRVPKKGEYVSNLAQGGKAVALELSDRERVLVEKMETWLEKSGIVFAGSDFIDGRLSEINVTSPTGFASYEALYGADPAGALFDAFLESP